jgi:sialic acid synthase SpsE
MALRKRRILKVESHICCKDIKAEEHSKENIRVIRPGYGLNPKYYENILILFLIKTLPGFIIILPIK